MRAGLIAFMMLLLVARTATASFPVVAAVNASESVANATDHVVALPAGIVSGNLLIILFVSDGVPVITWPSGWSQLFSEVEGTSVKVEARYRIADGTEGVSITVTTDALQETEHQTWRITGQHAISAPEAGAPGAGVSSAPDPPDLSPSWGAEDTLWIALFGADNSLTVTAYPTNYVDNQRAANSGGTGGVTIGSATRNLNVTLESAGPFTLSASENNVRNMLAIRPAIAAPPPPPLTPAAPVEFFPGPHVDPGQDVIEMVPG